MNLPIKIKNLFFKDIKLLITTDDDDNVDINPNFLEYFQIEELVSMKEQLIKRNYEIKKVLFISIYSLNSKF